MRAAITPDQAQQIDALSAALRSMWTRGSISLSCNPNHYSVSLHVLVLGECVHMFADTPSEAMNGALAKAAAKWPNDATIAATALEKAQADLARAQAAVDGLSK